MQMLLKTVTELSPKNKEVQLLVQFGSDFIFEE